MQRRTKGTIINTLLGVGAAAIATIGAMQPNQTLEDKLPEPVHVQIQEEIPEDIAGRLMHIHSYDYKSLIGSQVRERINYLMSDEGTEERCNLLSAFTRISRFEDIYRQASDNIDMDYDHAIASTSIESGGKNRANSKKNARGLQQFIRLTARSMGMTVNEYIDQRTKPDIAIPKGMEYLKKLEERFGDPTLAVMAYNDGETDLARLIEKYGTKDPNILIEHTPNETRRHIIKVEAAELLHRYASELGIVYTTLPLWSEKMRKTTSHKVRSGETMHGLARQAGVSVTELHHEYNPEIVNPSQLYVGQTIALPQQ